jgi:hypothetical protein
MQCRYTGEHRKKSKYASRRPVGVFDEALERIEFFRPFWRSKVFLKTIAVDVHRGCRQNFLRDTPFSTDECRRISGADAQSFQ